MNDMDIIEGENGIIQNISNENPQNTEVDLTNIIDAVKATIKKYDLGKDIKLQDYKKEIDVRCYIYIFSKRSIDLDETIASECNSLIDDFFGNNVINIDKMIDMRYIDDDYNNGLKYYYERYNIAIEILKYFTDEKFIDFDNVSKNQIIISTQEYLKQIIIYVKNFIKYHRYSDEKLISNSYNVLYLINFLNKEKVANNSELIELYNKVTEKIDQNIALYDKINVNLDRERVSVDDDGLTDMKNRLSQISGELDNQYKEIESKNNIFISNENKLKEFTDNSVRKIVDDIVKRDKERHYLPIVTKY